MVSTTSSTPMCTSRMRSPDLGIQNIDSKGQGQWSILSILMHKKHETVGQNITISAVMHAPFHASALRPPSQVGPMHKTAGMGKLINAALLSLMRRVWVYAVLPSSWVNSSAPLVCRHDRVTREVGRVGLVGMDRGRRGYWVALYLYIYTVCLLMSVFL